MKSIQGFGESTFWVIGTTPKFLAGIWTPLGGPENHFTPTFWTYVFWSRLRRDFLRTFLAIATSLLQK